MAHRKQEPLPLLVLGLLFGVPYLFGFWTTKGFLQLFKLFRRKSNPPHASDTD
jgi:hypothetical protein